MYISIKSMLNRQDGSPFLAAVVTEVPDCHLWALPGDPEADPGSSLKGRAGRPSVPYLEVQGSYSQSISVLVAQIEPGQRYLRSF